MASKNAPPQLTLDLVATRTMALEVQVIELHLLLNAVLMAAPNRDEILRKLEGDIEAWSHRKTLEAHEPAAAASRDALLAHIRALRSQWGERK